MSISYSTQNLVCSDEMELMMDSNLVSGAPSSPEKEVGMFVLERFVSNYGRPSSSPPPSIFYTKEEERSSDQGFDHQVVDQYHGSTTTSLQNQGGGFSDNLESKFGYHHHHHDVNINCINRSNLIRQSSSPPEFLSHSALDNNGFNSMRGGGGLGKDQLNFSSGSPTFSRQMPQITENGNDSNWDYSSFNGLKRARDHNDLKMFPSSSVTEIQKTDYGHCGGLTHHLSLPKNFGMPSREKILHFQGVSVPCKTRAKRGFATQPRSIAERVRRTRISERMKRLEDLFPNIDKQTSIADRLELAVEYIKDLQKQVETLTDTKAKCSCNKNNTQILVHDFPFVHTEENN